ncbi:unnamed protein product [Ilex paraguariensis]|uniref:Uncharacterized protein n=1 Tax=Ilex paraguariensis TaxID=185542 RepID=A0ABC8UPL0_9AQUA
MLIKCVFNLQEREKRGKKKAGASKTPPDSEAAAPERVDEHFEATAPVAPKNEDQKENTVRYRSRPKVPKAILKRKKSANYCLWAAALSGEARAVGVLALLKSLLGSPHNAAGKTRMG